MHVFVFYVKNTFCLEVTVKCWHIISTQCGSQPTRGANMCIGGSPSVTRETPSLRYRRLSIRGRGMTSHRHDRQRGIISVHSRMNGLCHVLSFTAKTARVIAALPACRFPLQNEYSVSVQWYSVSVSVKGKPASFVPMVDKKKKKLSQWQCDD